MTSTKKKVLTSVISLIAILVVAAVAFTAVWAARHTTVNSGFTIQYTAVHVKATIAGTYQVKGDASPTALSPESITFNGNEATDNSANVKSFTSVTPVLKEVGDEAYVDFVYTITNNETTNLMDIVLSSDPDVADNNLTYTYSVTLANNSDATSTGTTYGNLVTGLKPGKTATITIRATVDNLDNNVNATGTFAFVLTGVAAA